MKATIDYKRLYLTPIEELIEKTLESQEHLSETHLTNRQNGLSMN